MRQGRVGLSGGVFPQAPLPRPNSTHRWCDLRSSTSRIENTSSVRRTAAVTSGWLRAMAKCSSASFLACRERLCPVFGSACSSCECARSVRPGAPSSTSEPPSVTDEDDGRVVARRADAGTPPSSASMASNAGAAAARGFNEKRIERFEVK